MKACHGCAHLSWPQRNTSFSKHQHGWDYTSSSHEFHLSNRHVAGELAKMIYIYINYKWSHNDLSKNHPKIPWKEPLIRLRCRIWLLHLDDLRSKPLSWLLFWNGGFLSDDLSTGKRWNGERKPCGCAYTTWSKVLGDLRWGGIYVLSNDLYIYIIYIHPNTQWVGPQTFPEKPFKGSKHLLTRYLEDFGRLGLHI